MRYLFLSIVIINLSAHSYSATEVSVTDFLGQTITLDKPATRIIALAPHIVENIFSAGGGDAIVGVVDHCDYPEQAKSITNLGALGAFSLESIISLKPDLVVVWYTGSGGEILSSLKKLGLTTYASAPSSLNHIAKSIRDFGVLTGNSGIAEKRASNFEEKYQDLLDKFSNKNTVSAFYQVWNEPILTINKQSVISDVITTCGGQNVFADSPLIVPKLSTESILLEKPKAIIASGMADERPEWLDKWKQWPSIPAVANDHLFFIPPDIIQRYSARILEGAALLCEQLERVRKHSSDYLSDEHVENDQ